jgi:hypothetical protein
LKYIEFGIGNTWLIRTEFELEDGSEYEQKGIQLPILCHSVYLRIWVGKTVWIIDSKEGFLRKKKSRKAFKLIFGICSDIEKRENP